MTVSFERIAIIDIGKTNAKVVIVDARTGAEVAVRKTANIVLAGPPYPHFDTERLWTFILDTLAEFAGHPGFDALSITTHGASAALLDDKGALALPVLDYEYVYPDEVNRAYDLLRPNFDESFSPRLTGGLNLGAQFHFQRDRFPQEFARVSTILTLPQYWAFRLTGVAANEKTSLGCHTDLWRPFADSYSALVARLDIATFDLAPGVVDRALDFGPAGANPDLSSEMSEEQIMKIVQAYIEAGIDIEKVDTAVWEKVGAYAAATSIYWNKRKLLPF